MAISSTSSTSSASYSSTSSLPVPNLVRHYTKDQIDGFTYEKWVELAKRGGYAPSDISPEKLSDLVFQEQGELDKYTIEVLSQLFLDPLLALFNKITTADNFPFRPAQVELRQRIWTVIDSKLKVYDLSQLKKIAGVFNTTLYAKGIEPPKKLEEGLLSTMLLWKLRGSTSDLSQSSYGFLGGQDEVGDEYTYANVKDHKEKEKEQALAAFRAMGRPKFNPYVPGATPYHR